MHIDWNTILPIVVSNGAMFITSYINMQIRMSNLDNKLGNFEKSLEKIVSKVDSLDQHQLTLHTNLTRLETRFEMFEKRSEK
jgi:peptidoglycan hydrolase CwlO-like protein